MTRLREKAYAAYAPHHQGHPSLTPYRESSQGDDDEDKELKTLGGKTNIAQLPQAVRPQRSLLNGTIYQDAYPKSPMPIPLNDHLDNMHPLLLEYVAQSRWSGVATTTSTEVGQTAQQYTSHSVPSAEHLYVMGAEQHYDPPGRRMQDDAYANHWDRHTNPVWNNSSHLPQGSHPHDGFAHMQHSYYSTNPALQSFPELNAESNQYAAWQAHMQQLGLPF